MVNLKRQQAEAYGYIDSPYDALLEDYEPGENKKNLESVFSALGKALPPLIERITAAARSTLCNRRIPGRTPAMFGEMAARRWGSISAPDGWMRGASVLLHRGPVIPDNHPF